MSKTELQELTPTGQALLGEAFFDGEERITEDDLGPYLNGTGIYLNLSPLDTLLEDLVEEEQLKGNKPAIDGEIAPAVHDILDLSRREASIDGIWHYLTVLRYPEFVRYRWDSKMGEKFLKGGEDIYSNALHRLWWMAEISRDGTDYDRTEQMLSMQELANDIADRWFARYRPITHACIDALRPEAVESFEPANSAIASKTTTKLREKLTVVCAEALDYDQALALVEETRDNTIDRL